MQYVVYVNHPNNKAIVHRQDCGRYQGRRRNATHNGYWTPLFANQQQAKDCAKATQKKNVDTCAFCIG